MCLCVFVGSFFRNYIINTVPSYCPLMVTCLVSLVIQMNLVEYSLDRSKGHFDLKKGREKVTFKADSSEQLSKWIAQLQSTLLEAKGEGDQISVQGTEGGEGVADTNRHIQMHLYRTPVRCVLFCLPGSSQYSLAFGL